MRIPRWALLVLAAAWTAPAGAQVTANLPVTCNAAGTNCAVATPVTNPDGTLVGSSAGNLQTRGAVNDGSGTVTTGGTAQQVFAANATRIYLYCQNPVAATETLFVNISGTASTTGGSYELAPGASASFQQQFIPNGIVSVTAATTGHRFVCKQSG